MVHIIENDFGTIKADVTLSGIDIDELCLEAEVQQLERCCEITRAFIRVTSGYEQNLCLTKLHAEVKDWESEIIEALEKEHE